MASKREVILRRDSAGKQVQAVKITARIGQTSPNSASRNCRGGLISRSLADGS